MPIQRRSSIWMAFVFGLLSLAAIGGGCSGKPPPQTEKPSTPVMASEVPVVTATKQQITPQSSGAATYATGTPTALPATPGITVYPTSTPTALAATAISSTTTPGIPSVLSVLLPSGQYLAYELDTENGASLYVLSIQNGLSTQLTSDMSGSLSPDGKWIASSSLNKLSLVNLRQRVVTYIPDNDECLKNPGQPTWSPDETLLALPCGGSIVLARTVDGEIAGRTPQATAPPIPFWVDHLVWSPNGQWIAFYTWQDNPQNRVDGPYVVKASCLKDPNCRSGSRRMATGSGVAAWTSDNNLAVSSWSDPDRSAIRVYDVNTGQLLYVFHAPDPSQRVESMVWSPDGKWVAVGQFALDDLSGAIYLMSRIGGSTTKFATKSDKIVSWLTIP